MDKGCRVNERHPLCFGRAIVLELQQRQEKNSHFIAEGLFL